MVGPQAGEIKCGTQREMLATYIAIEREMPITDADVLPPTGCQVQCALPQTMVEVNLVTHRKANAVEKLLLEPWLAQSISCGVRRCCAHARGKHVVEFVKSQDRKSTRLNSSHVK